MMNTLGLFENKKSIVPAYLELRRWLVISQLMYRAQEVRVWLPAITQYSPDKNNRDIKYYLFHLLSFSRDLIGDFFSPLSSLLLASCTFQTRPFLLAEGVAQIRRTDDPTSTTNLAEDKEQSKHKSKNTQLTSAYCFQTTTARTHPVCNRPEEI